MLRRFGKALAGLWKVTHRYEAIFLLSIVVVATVVWFYRSLGLPTLVAGFLFTILPIQIGLLWLIVDNIRNRWDALPPNEHE
ncbi:MAG: hypothetical protein JO264_21765 [Acidisphaera sp.]|nr:hypothetical protein [Acidisphaera sp.]